MENTTNSQNTTHVTHSKQEGASGPSDASDSGDFKVIDGIILGKKEQVILGLLAPILGSLFLAFIFAPVSSYLAYSLFARDEVSRLFLRQSFNSTVLYALISLGTSVLTIALNIIVAMVAGLGLLGSFKNPVASSGFESISSGFLGYFGSLGISLLVSLVTYLFFGLGLPIYNAFRFYNGQKPYFPFQFHLMKEKSGQSL